MIRIKILGGTGTQIKLIIPYQNLKFNFLTYIIVRPVKPVQLHLERRQPSLQAMGGQSQVERRPFNAAAATAAAVRRRGPG